MTGTYAGQFVMEGFLDIKLPVWKRVLLTRTIAIVPALSVVFMSSFTLTNLDTFLNILQSVQLPFALVPLIKFSSSPEIMGVFAISRANFYFSSFLGLLLFLMNFVIIFTENKVETWRQLLMICVGIVVYVSLIVMAIREPVSPLKPISEQDLDDDEYKKVIVEGFEVKRRASVI